MIGAYRDQPAVCRDHDPRAFDVARKVAGLIQAQSPDLVVEHIGSTAVLGCAGKGIVDLMLLYPDGRLAPARNVLEALGFQRQTTRDPFPEDRPMRTGSVVHDATTFYLHVHVIAVSSPEVEALRSFRDRLRSDPNLLAAYVATKRTIIAEGCTDSVDYSIRKGEFIMQRSKDGTDKGSKTVEKVKLRNKFALFSERWSPKIVGELNGQQVKLVKFEGPFVWHHHDNEDELFLVVKGRFRMEFRDRHIWVNEGEFLIVPHGIEHRPVAEDEAHVLLFEPASTLNTGNVRNERTLEQLERI
jgi:GrpB-like predicted nucleotidyltransferase (UPF0157 family)/mannose-6-phosphate isomerase-like protein (cupin superfamily)